MAESTSTLSDNDTQSLVRHPFFFMQEEFVYFQIEMTLIRVPKSTFVHCSPVFREMFECPHAPGEQPEGRSEANPIRLPDRLEDFTALLQYFHPHIGAGKPTSKDQWLSILILANKYQMTVVQSEACGALSSFDFDPIEKIEITGRLDIPLVWAKDAIVKLCSRYQPISVGESILMERRLAAAISQVREFRVRRGKIQAKIKKNDKNRRNFSQEPVVHVYPEFRRERQEKIWGKVVALMRGGRIENDSDSDVQDVQEWG